MIELSSLPAINNSFLTVVENLHLMVFLLQKKRLIYVNTALCQDLGYKKEELFSKHFEICNTIDPEYHKKAREHFKRVTEPSTIELVLLSKNHEKIYSIVNTSFINFNGKITLQGFITNISEQKELEKKVRESEEKFREITNSSQDLIYTVNIQGRFIYVNSSVQELLGCSPQEFLGTMFSDWLSKNPKNQKALLDYYKILNEGGSPPPFDLELITKLGEIKIFEFRERQIFSDNGVIVAVHGIGRDITDRKATEARLKESEDRYRRLTRTLRQINHQLTLSERRYRSLFEKLPLIVLILSFDKLGQIITVNQKTTTLMGYRKEELIDNNVTMFFNSESEKMVFTQKLRDLLKIATIGPFEVLWITKNKKPVSLELIASPVEVEQDLRAIQILGKDITEQKELERTFLHLKKDLAPQIVFTLYNFGSTGLNVLATDPLYFTNDQKSLLLKLGVFSMSSLTQGKDRSLGLFGPLPIAGHPFNFLVYAFNIENRELSDSRMQGKDYCLLLIIFPKNLHYIFKNRLELRKLLDKYLPAKSLDNLNMTLLREIRNRIFFASGGID